MSDVAKKARAAMKAKAHRLGSDRPLEKVDSSTWTPAPMINADVKTGLRPVSRRQFKKGGKVVGKVHGEEAMQRADRKPRKSGGEVKEWVNAKINRNVKDANEEREGKKHIGAMKKGGRIGRENGGAAPRTTDERIKNPNPSPDYSPKTDPNYKPDDAPSQSDRDALARMSGATTRKNGGRAKKMDGGQMGALLGPVGGANRMMQQAAGVAGVPNALMGFNRGSSRLQRAAGLKKGGKAVGHPDEAADKALIKKMVKPSARTGKAKGGSLVTSMAAARPNSRVEIHKTKDDLQPYVVKHFRDGTHDADMDEGYTSRKEAKEMAAHSAKKGYWKGDAAPRSAPSKNAPADKGDVAVGDYPYKRGGRTGRATGGQVFSGPGYPGKIPGAVPGGRTARAHGGSAKRKGKTDINIVINAEKGGAGAGMMPPGGMPGGPPKGMPVPVPPAPGGMPPGMPMGMMPPGMMPPGGAPPMPPQGGMPMPRKSGGRTYRSYKDMDAGAGGAKGREEKTEIAKRKGGIQKA